MQLLQFPRSQLSGGKRQSLTVQDDKRRDADLDSSSSFADYMRVFCPVPRATGMEVSLALFQG